MIASSVDENMGLYERIRSGDESAIREMIERNMPLALGRANAFSMSHRRFKHLKDDLVGEAYLALTTVVRSFVENEATKPTGRMVFEIDRHLGDYIDTEIGSGMMSSRSVQRKRADGDIPHRLPIDVSKPPRSLWNHADGRVVRKIISEEGNSGQVADLAEGSPYNGPADIIGKKDQISRGDARQLVATHIQPDSSERGDLLDLILSVCGCEEEEMIVQLRIKGYTDTEIGEQMNLSQQTVSLRRQQIEERFEATRKKLNE